MASRLASSPVALRALAAQLAAWVVLAPLLATGLPVSLIALAQGAIAAFVGHRLGLDRWWRPIHLVFSPLACLAYATPIPPSWYLAGFIALMLVYGGVFRSRVPLYLSSRAAADALTGYLAPGARLMDLGSGTGSLLVPLARRLPNVHCAGIEAAALPYLVCRWRSLGKPNLSVAWGDFWRRDLGPYDAVYAYLSPAPMVELWDKVRREMRPGALFVSNSFPVPHVPPAEVVALDDLHRSRLYIYRL